MRILILTAAILTAATPIAVSAQLSLKSLGGGVPGLGSAGVGNAAGLLGYCLKNKLLGGATSSGAAGVLGKLTGRPEVKDSPGFTLGQAGKVEQPGGGALSLNGLTGKLKSQACDVVLKRAGSFL